MAGNKPNSSAQSIVPIRDIKEGVIIMNDGSFRSVISVESINLALKSEQEKDSYSFSYQGFLNSLDFPIQILSVSRKLDLSDYQAKINQVISQEQNPFIKIQAEEYSHFIDSLLVEANIMDKEFFIVLSFYPSGIDQAKKGIFAKKNVAPEGLFEENKRGLLMRIQEVENGLAGMGLRSKVLNSEEISDLLYILYNPDVANNMKIGSAIGTIQEAIVSGSSAPGEANATL